MLRSRAAIVATMLALSTAAVARAAGYEDTVGGGVALGRAANYVRANDFMATWQNPANLALVPGRDIGLELRLPIFNACFDRARDPSLEYKPEESFAEVCNETKAFPAGNLGFATSFANGIGFGVGLFTPAGVSKLRFGDDTIVTVGQGDFPDEQYPLTTSGEPSASRYLLLERQVLPVYLMAGIGYAFAPWLRAGLSAGFGIVSISFANVASLTGRTFLDQEVHNDVHVRDGFVPRLTASLAATPLPSVDLMAQVTVNADVVATGHADETANGIRGAPRGDCRAADPGPHCRVDGVELHVPYPRVELYLGARYAQRRSGVTRGPKLEPMHEEVWDVELDLFWVNTSHVDAFTLTLYDVPPSDPDAAKIDFTSDPSGVPSPLPPRANIPHRWRDTWGLRVGGDYNVLRDRFALRAGLAYESRAMRRSYMNIDYWPVDRVSLHAGATAKFGMLKLSLAYAHIFYDATRVGIGEGRVPEIAAVDAALAQPVNEGSYEARADLLSLQANVAF